jgi:hypothetical protein
MNSAELINIITESRIKLLSLVEELAGAAGLLREANDDEKNQNRVGAIMCLDDAMGFLAAVETQSSEISAKIARVIESES